MYYIGPKDLYSVPKDLVPLLIPILFNYFEQLSNRQILHLVQKSRYIN